MMAGAASPLEGAEGLCCFAASPTYHGTACGLPSPDAAADECAEVVHITSPLTASTAACLSGTRAQGPPRPAPGTQGQPRLLLTTHYALLTTHHSPLTTHCYSRVQAQPMVAHAAARRAARRERGCCSAACRWNVPWARECRCGPAPRTDLATRLRLSLHCRRTPVQDSGPCRAVARAPRPGAVHGAGGHGLGLQRVQRHRGQRRPRPRPADQL